MAQSTCIKCNSTHFEMVEAIPTNVFDFTFNYVQCAKCGGVVGVLEKYNNNDLIKRLAKALNVKLKPLDE